MMTLTITDMPEELHRRLQERAAQHRRSLNSEILDCLKQATASPPEDVEARLARIRAFRASLTMPPITEEDVERAINEGRR